MNRDFVDKIVNAVLYEGYILYPYRASSKKNQRERFTFGRVYPEAYSIAEGGVEPCMMQTECVVSGESPRLTVSIRFLQPVSREIAVASGNSTDLKFQMVPELCVEGQLFQTWLEAVERRVELPSMQLNPGHAWEQAMPFRFPASQTM